MSSCAVINCCCTGRENCLKFLRNVSAKLHSVSILRSIKRSINVRIPFIVYVAFFVFLTRNMLWLKVVVSTLLIPVRSTHFWSIKLLCSYAKITRSQFRVQISKCGTTAMVTRVFFATSCSKLNNNKVKPKANARLTFLRRVLFFILKCNKNYQEL